MCIFEELFGRIAAVVIQEAIFPTDIIRWQVVKQIAKAFALLFHVRTKSKIIFVLKFSYAKVAVTEPKNELIEALTYQK